MSTSDTVFILGAGFSAAAGCPVIGDFAEKAFALDSRLRRFFPNTEPAKGLRKFLRYSAQCRKRWMVSSDEFDFDNFEHIITMANLDVALQYQKEEDLTDYVNAVGLVYTETPNLQWQKNSIKECALNKMIIANDNFAHLPREYVAFVALCSGIHPELPEVKCSAISLNYDLVVERVAQAMGIGVSYGMLRSARGGDYEVSLQGRASEVVKLFKIHGSVNWYRTQGGVNCRQNMLDPFSISPRRLCESPQSRWGSMLIVPPTFSKDFKDIGTFRRVWSEAYNSLIRARTVVVIGCSFSAADIHIRHLLYGAFSESKNLRTVYDVNLDDRNSREEIYNRIFSSSFVEKFVRFSFSETSFAKAMGYDTKTRRGWRDYKGGTIKSLLSLLGEPAGTFFKYEQQLAKVKFTLHTYSNEKFLRLTASDANTGDIEISQCKFVLPDQGYLDVPGSYPVDESTGERVGFLISRKHLRKILSERGFVEGKILVTVRIFARNNEQFLTTPFFFDIDKNLADT